MEFDDNEAKRDTDKKLTQAKCLPKINFKNIGTDGFSLALFGTKVSDSN